MKMMLGSRFRLWLFGLKWNLELEKEMEDLIPNPKFWLPHSELSSSSQVQDLGLFILSVGFKQLIRPGYRVSGGNIDFGLQQFPQQYILLMIDM